MVLLLSRQKMSRSIRNIFSEALILNYNLDGSQSKKKLNIFENFLPALLSEFLFYFRIYFNNILSF